MQGVIRAIAIVYLIFMTLLLLSSAPARSLHVNWRLLQWLSPWAHLLSFLLLAILVLSVRWPIPRWGVLLLLVFYAGATEFAQGFVQNRSREWKDWFMDLAGLAVGTALCWGAALLTAAAARAKRRHPQSPADHWEVMQKIMSRSAAGQSWWG